MCGPLTRRYADPKPLKLYGKDLPWVSHATHLGHELSKDGTMELDANMKRGQFISNSMDIRSMFSFALPDQILKAVNVYCGHFYGAMLWDLYGERANQIFRSWNSCVKLAWGVPRNTHNYFVENLLAADYPSVRCNVLNQYTGFLKRLRRSTSDEVRIMSQISVADIRSVTGRNCFNIMEEFNLCPLTCQRNALKNRYKLYVTPTDDIWRLSLLGSLLNQRYDIETMGDDSTIVCGLIESLCTT